MTFESLVSQRLLVHFVVQIYGTKAVTVDPKNHFTARILLFVLMDETAIAHPFFSKETTMKNKAMSSTNTARM
jgi:hypothetical protein